jgi:hypothetical protein
MPSQGKGGGGVRARVGWVEGDGVAAKECKNVEWSKWSGILLL